MPQKREGYGSEARKQQPRSRRWGIVGEEGTVQGAGMLRTVGSLKTTEAHMVDPYGFPHRVDHFTPAEILTSNLKRNQMLQKT